MEVTQHRTLKDGISYNALFPSAIQTEQTVKKNASVSHTVAFIPKVVRETQWQVKKFVERELAHLPLESACEKLWHFVKDHIGYRKDKYGTEQVRSPRRLWHDRIGDCDCYTVFIGACLTVLEVPKLIFRITKYGKDHFQHIYPIVKLDNGKQITMDCVVNRYNYEEPYTEKKDYPMELTYLDGIPDNLPSDAQQLYENNALSELGALFKRKNKTPDQPKKKLGEKLKAVGQKIKEVGQKVKTAVGKTIHAVNRVNPVTVVLRNGVLAAMKLNMMKVAQRLKYAYLSDSEAQKRGIDMAKFQKLKEVRAKMEKIFHGAGGKPENLKAAILTGKGNTNKEVSGLGYLPSQDVNNMDLNTPLHKLLGQEIFYSENTEGHEELKGLGELGEPVTAASVTAASGVLAAIAAILKNIGSIFKSKEKGSEDFENTTDADTEAANTPATDLDDFTFPTDESDVPNSRSMDVSTEDDEVTEEKKDKSADTNPDASWWEKNKKWAKPTAWVAGILAALGIGYGVYASNKKGKKKEKSVNGMPKLQTKKKNTKKKGRGLQGTGKITPVALM